MSMLRKCWVLAGLSISINCLIMVVMFDLALGLEFTRISDWKSPVALGKVISTLMTIAQVSVFPLMAEGLRFASRYRLSARLALISYGVLFGVAALATFQLAQQILSFDPCDNVRTKPPGLTAIIKVNHDYSLLSLCAEYGEILAAWIAGDHVSYLQQSLKSKCIDASIRNAFHAGLFDPNAIFENFCPGMVCTWPDFPALGVCSECEDVTKSTQISSAVKGMWDGSVHLTTPKGLQLILDAPGKTKDPMGRLGSEVAVSASKDISKDAVVILDFAYAQEIPEAVFTGGETTYVVTECQLKWCAKVFRDVKSVSPFSYVSIRLLSRWR